MIEIKEILKKEIPDFIERSNSWNESFLPISKHRIYAHYKNPTCDDNDIVLLLAYLDKELVGYMGVFIDKIVLKNIEHKIGWLSTWWVHPKTKGLGIGREILNTMYQKNNGKIGISQFTPAAKRVYDKSGYFVELKENYGIKGVLRSNLYFVVPTLFPKAIAFVPVLKGLDTFLNIFINLKLSFQKGIIKKGINNIQLEYLNVIDSETMSFINKYNKDHISPKNAEFFEWLKTYNWVLEAPLLEYTENSKYAFSMLDKSFSIYLIKIIEKNNTIGFIVLQKRNDTIKVLFAYYDSDKHSEIISKIIKLHCIELGAQEIICYDPSICKNLFASSIFIYKRKKVKNSIISKAFNQSDFANVTVNFGDGDCSFA